jgi:hypothetical protein
LNRTGLSGGGWRSAQAEGAHGGGPVRVLVLGSSSEEDYVRDMLLHGLRSWPSLAVTDARRPPHLYLEHGADRAQLYGHGFSYAEWLPPPSPLWRAGGSGGAGKGEDRSDAQGGETGEDEEEACALGSGRFRRPWQRGEKLRAAVARRAFDLVVYGSVHRGLPFLAEVTAAYAKVRLHGVRASLAARTHCRQQLHGHLPFFSHPCVLPQEEIAFVDGEDAHGWAGGWCASVAALAHRGHYFMREMPDGCPSPSL